MKANPPTGASGEQRFVVAPEHTIHFAAANLDPVLSTPSLIWHLEHAAIEALSPFLDPEEISLGTEIEIAHLAPTPLGMGVTCVARVIRAEGAKVSFQVEARDEEELIARGSHLRFVVRAESFARRLTRKSASR